MERFERLHHLAAEWMRGDSIAEGLATEASLEALLHKVDAEATERAAKEENERCARLIETQYRRETRNLLHEDEFYNAEALRMRVRQRDAAAIRASRFTLPTPAAQEAQKP